MDSMTSTLAMSMPSQTLSMMMHMHNSSSMDHLSGMSHMHSMNMYFTTLFKDYPVLFSKLSAHTKGQAFGIFVLLFIVAFLCRGLEFARNYLEARVWNNPAYQAQCHPPVDNVTGADKACCTTKDRMDDSSSNDKEPLAAPSKPQIPLATSLFRDAIRLVLFVVPDIISYALMLAAMTYTLAYFFAVAVGSGVGRFAFQRLSDRLRVSPGYFSAHC